MKQISNNEEIVEKSVVMVYNKLLNFTGVTGNPGKITAGRIRQLC